MKKVQLSKNRSKKITAILIVLAMTFVPSPFSTDVLANNDARDRLEKTGIAYVSASDQPQTAGKLNSIDEPAVIPPEWNPKPPSINDTTTPTNQIDSVPDEILVKIDTQEPNSKSTRSLSSASAETAASATQNQLSSILS